MINHKEHAELIKKAQHGDKVSLSRLAEVARVYLREYVWRVTLQEDLTEDIVQESILEMFKVFEKLKKADRFWAWLHGIAFNKIRSHYGRQWRHRTTSLSEIAHEIATEESQNALADLVNRELKLIVLRSMRELSPRHRAILTMRCYKEMAYSDIARLMGCSEFGAQALFYRAKKALAKKLSGHGLGKGYLLTALVLFGKLTAATEATAANVSVTAATLKVGVAASLAAIVTSKTAIVSLTAASTIAASTVVIMHGTDNIDNGLKKISAQTSTITPQQAQANGPMEQCWYFFPEGSGGPVMMRLLEFSKTGKQSYCRYMQNQHANYSSDKTTVCMNNYRMYNPDLSVRILPTDNEDLSRFISQVEGKPLVTEHVSVNGKGLLVISKRSSDNGDRIWGIDRHFNVLEEEYFQCDWPQSAKTIDKRDQMHRRGWTYFKLSGQINEKQISGIGRIPFVYVASKKFSAWLKMQIGNSLTIVDNGTAACVLDKSGKALAAYAGGSFFKGLGRPWMGLHTIDTVRRDAAEKRLSFETIKILSDGKAEVVLTSEKAKLIYTVDMETDVIEKITFSTDRGDEGELRFSYLQNIDITGSEFTRPGTESYSRPQQSPPGILWLVKLIKNNW